MLSFYITQSSPFSLKLWVTSGCTYPYFISHCTYFSFLGILPLAKIETCIKWMKFSFCDQKKQFRGEYYKYVYQYELDVGLLPTPQRVDVWEFLLDWVADFCLGRNFQNLGSRNILCSKVGGESTVVKTKILHWNSRCRLLRRDSQKLGSMVDFWDFLVGGSEIEIAVWCEEVLKKWALSLFCVVKWLVSWLWRNELLVAVKFKLPSSAEDCIGLMNGRFFGGMCESTFIYL